MNCRYNNDDIMNYMNDAMSIEENEKMTAHLEECESCKQQYRMASIIFGYANKGYEPDKDFSRKLIGSLDSVRYVGKLKKFRRRNIMVRIGRIAKVSAVVCACCIFVFMAVFVIRLSGVFDNKDTNISAGGTINDGSLNSIDKTTSNTLYVYQSGFVGNTTQYVVSSIRYNSKDLKLYSKVFIKAGLNNIESYQYITDKIYYFNLKDKMVECVDLKGKVTKLDFTYNNSDSYNMFLTSEDGKKIAWTEWHYDNGTNKNTSNLMVSDISGKNKRQVYSINMSGQEYLAIAKWGKNKDEIYIGKRLGGLGGLVVYEYLEDLTKINIRSGKTVTIMKSKQRTYNDSDYISAISPDEKYVAYLDKSSQTNFDTASSNKYSSLFVLEVNTGILQEYQMPFYSEDIRGYGDSLFSPDSSKLKFELALADPGNKDYPVTFRYFIADLDLKDLKNFEVPKGDEDDNVIWNSENTIALLGSNVKIMHIN